MTTNPNPTPLQRRGLAGGLLFAAALAHRTAAGQAPGAASTNSATSQSASTEPWATAQRQRRTPDVPLLDHEGRALRFYSDVMRGQRVVLNVMYSVCSNVCLPATQNLLQARQLLGEQARGLRFVSMSLTPLTDTPAALQAYRKLHGIEGDWTFLTGKPEHVERVQRALGFISNEPGDDLLSHSAMARYCDERLQRWTHINTLAPPRSVARSIRFEMA